MVCPINEEGSICATILCGQAAASQCIAVITGMHYGATFNQNASQAQECLVNVRPFFIADAQSPELVQPCETHDSTTLPTPLYLVRRIHAVLKLSGKSTEHFSWASGPHHFSSWAATTKW